MSTCYFLRAPILALKVDDNTRPNLIPLTPGKCFWLVGAVRESGLIDITDGHAERYTVFYSDLMERAESAVQKGQ